MSDPVTLSERPSLEAIIAGLADDLIALREGRITTEEAKARATIAHEIMPASISWSKPAPCSKRGRSRSKAKQMSDLFPIDTPVEKIGGSYGGPGVVRGHAVTETGEVRYLVGHRIEGGYGEFLHVYPPSLMRRVEGGEQK